MDALQKKNKEFATPRAIQTKITKERIVAAAAEILREKGYAYLTIGNICKAADVSNGTFFYHFKTKEELLTFFAYDNFATYRCENGFDEQASKLSYRDRILLFYTYWAEYMEYIGLDFFSKFYTTSNYSLDVRRWTDREPATIWRYPMEVLTEAKRKNMLRENVSVLRAQEILATITKGIAFDWCLTDGTSDMHSMLQEIMVPYLNNIFLPE